jgi:hypothetical protein
MQVAKFFILLELVSVPRQNLNFFKNLNCLIPVPEYSTIRQRKGIGASAASFFLPGSVAATLQSSITPH